MNVLMKNLSNFPVTFTLNLAGTLGPDPFFPDIFVCQQLQSPLLKLEQKHHACTTLPDASASGGFALSCERKPAAYSASLFLHLFVYHVSERRLIVFFFPSRSDHPEWP